MNDPYAAARKLMIEEFGSIYRLFDWSCDRTGNYRTQLTSRDNEEEVLVVWLEHQVQHVNNPKIVAKYAAALSHLKEQPNE